MFRFVLYPFLILLLFPVQVFADDSFPEDFLEIEGIGVYKSTRDGGLGDGVWDGSRRAEIAALMRQMPVTSDSYTVQRMIKAVLLGESQTDALEDADAFDADTDLLVLRLDRLIDGGFYADALTLFTTVKQEAYYPALLKRGILAMLGSGEKSLACLESKTLDIEGYEDDGAFWDTLAAYCDYTLHEEPPEGVAAMLESSPYEIVRAAAFKKDFRFTFDPADAEAFDALSMFERAVLIAQNAIAVEGINDAAIRGLSSRHVAALLSAHGLDDGQWLLLHLRAAQVGILPSDALGEFYVGFEGAGEAPTLVQYYRTLKQPKADTDKSAVLVRALSAVADFDGLADVALAPFVSHFGGLEGKDLTAEQMRIILRTYNRTQVAIPDFIFDEFAQNIEQKMENPSYGDDIQAYDGIILALLLLKADDEKHLLSTLVHKNGKPVENKRFHYFNVIENLDKQHSDDDNAPIVYEKGFTLTESNAYDLPQQALWKRYNEVGQDKILGETVMLSVLMLHKLPLSGLYPGLFEDVVRNLSNIGLKPVSEEIAIEALLGDVTK